MSCAASAPTVSAPTVSAPTVSAPEMNLSLYIPSVYSNITAQDIKDTFERMCVGVIDRVEITEKKQYGKNCSSAIVYFDRWFQTDISKNIQHAVSQMDGVYKFCYSKKSEWTYWILVANKHAAVKPSSEVILTPVSKSSDHALRVPSVPDAPKKLQRSVSEAAVSVPSILFRSPSPEDELSEPDYSLVSADYAEQLEEKIHQLQRENHYIRTQWHAAHTAWINSHTHLQYVQDTKNKWFHLIENRQFDRLYRTAIGPENDVWGLGPEPVIEVDLEDEDDLDDMEDWPVVNTLSV